MIKSYDLRRFLNSKSVDKNFHFELSVARVNQLKPNGLAFPYKKDNTISNFRGAGWYFSFFYPNFDRTFYKQIEKILSRHHIMRCLIWVCTVCLCSIKSTLGLYGLYDFFLFSNKIYVVGTLKNRLRRRFFKIPARYILIEKRSHLHVYFDLNSYSSYKSLSN